MYVFHVISSHEIKMAEDLRCVDYIDMRFFCLSLILIQRFKLSHVFFRYYFTFDL